MGCSGSPVRTMRNARAQANMSLPGMALSGPRRPRTVRWLGTLDSARSKSFSHAMGSGPGHRLNSRPANRGVAAKFWSSGTGGGTKALRSSFSPRALSSRWHTAHARCPRQLSMPTSKRTGTIKPTKTPPPHRSTRHNRRRGGRTGSVISPSVLVGIGRIHAGHAHLVGPCPSQDLTPQGSLA